MSGNTNRFARRLPNPPVLGHFGSASTELEDHVLKVSEINQRYRQVGRRSFQGAVRGLRQRDITVFRESTYPEVFQEGWLNWSGLVVLIPAHASERSYFSGHWLARNQMALMSGNREFLYRTPAQLELDVVLVSDELVRSIQGEDSPPPGDQLAIRDLSDELGRRIGSYVEALLTAPTATELSCAPEDCLHQRSQQITQRLLSALLLESAAEMPRGFEHRAHSINRTKIVVRALEYIHDGLDEPLDVLSVCQYLHISRRQLQKCFEHVLGVGSAEYILRQRLLRARQRLLERRGSSRNVVTTTAYECGFWHLGRFAAYYRRMFHELPHTTAGSEPTG
jgi:AraC family ethanolamine operon transcriptional activator